MMTQVLALSTGQIEVIVTLLLLLQLTLVFPDKIFLGQTVGFIDLQFVE